jgi:hypothetical protein
MGVPDLRACLDCGRPTRSARSPRCAPCRDRKRRADTRFRVLAHRDRERGVETPPDEPEEAPSGPEPPVPAPISHAPPLPALKFDPGSRPSAPPDEADPWFYITDAHTTDLTRWIQDPTQPLEARRRVRDELVRRENVAEEGRELDTIRWHLRTHGQRI